MNDTDIRFFYWLDADESDTFRADTLSQRVRPTPAIGVPCKAMNPMLDLAFVAPKEWNKVCRRQGSWYRESRLAGKTLVISRAPIASLSDQLSGAIRPCDFEAPTLPENGDALALCDRPGYRDAEPEDWTKLTPREIRYWQNLLARIGFGEGVEELIDFHSANHANFIEPEYAVGANGDCAPYSIGATKDVCSACVELFNILGEEFDRKYVMPCPGFVLYSTRPVDRYLEVLSGSSARSLADSWSTDGSNVNSAEASSV